MLIAIVVGGRAGAGVSSIPFAGVAAGAIHALYGLITGSNSI
jgi:hypothetical protein